MTESSSNVRCFICGTLFDPKTPEKYAFSADRQRPYIPSLKAHLCSYYQCRRTFEIQFEPATSCPCAIEIWINSKRVRKAFESLEDMQSYVRNLDGSLGGGDRKESIAFLLPPDVVTSTDTLVNLWLTRQKIPKEQFESLKAELIRRSMPSLGSFIDTMGLLKTLAIGSITIDCSNVENLKTIQFQAHLFLKDGWSLIVNCPLRKNRGWLVNEIEKMRKRVREMDEERNEMEIKLQRLKGELDFGPSTEKN